MSSNSTTASVHSSSSPQSSVSKSSSTEKSKRSSIDIDYWSRSFLALVYPVSFMVIISAGLAILLFDLYTQPNVFEEAGLIMSSKGPNAGSISKITLESFKIALIVIGVFALATILLVIFVYYRCMKLLYVYLFITVICVFSVLNTSMLSMIVAQLNIPVDWITTALYVFNILTVAILAMFWIAPDFVKQSVTIYQCIIMVLYVLKIAPEWIAWALLPLLAVWDMIAVLLPFGPLYLLIGLFQKRNIQVPPMMIYTTGLWLDDGQRNTNALIRAKQFFRFQLGSTMNLLFLSQRTIQYLQHHDLDSYRMKNTNASPLRSSKKRAARKSMLGLGDFIFYSILLAKTVFTSECNLFAIIIVYLSIIMGMLATTTILLVIHRPLPALPISLLIGLAIFFQYHFIGNEFADALRLPTGPVIL